MTSNKASTTAEGASGKIQCPYCSGLHPATAKYCPKTGRQLGLTVESRQRPAGNLKKVIKRNKYYILTGIVFLGCVAIVMQMLLSSPQDHEGADTPSLPPVVRAPTDVKLGMVPIRTLDNTHWIDEFEVSIDDYAKVMNNIPEQPKGATGDMPVVNVTYADAKAYANKVGKRLCTVQEWKKATGVGDGQRLDLFKSGLASESKAMAQGMHGRQYLMDRSVIKAYNLLGNVKEWVASDDDMPQYMGSSYLEASPDVDIVLEPQRITEKSANDIGFRCCAIILDGSRVNTSPVNDIKPADPSPERAFGSQPPAKVPEQRAPNDDALEMQLKMMQMDERTPPRK